MELKDVEYTPSYIKVVISRDNAQREVHDAEMWCRQTVCGKRVNLWTFAFKTEAEYLMFRLKWL